MTTDPSITTPDSRPVIYDNHGRPITYLRLAVTDRCNLRCFYCMPEEGIKYLHKSKLLSYEEMLRIVGVLAELGVHKVRITGGEPFVRNNLVDFLYRLADIQGIDELNITTNGVLTGQYLKQMKEIGIRSVNLSLDTLVATKFNTITLRNQFEKVIDNLHLLLNNDFKVKVNVVLMKGFNENEIVDFVKLTQFLPISVRFIEFMPFAGNEWDRSKMVSQNEILSKVETCFTSDKIQKLEDEKNFTARTYKIKGFQGDFGIISSITNPFCDSCNRIRLTANGKIKNCLFSNSETDLLTAFRNGESITNLIAQSVQNKKKVRAGMETFSEINDPSLHFDNRSMIAIGG